MEAERAAAKAREKAALEKQRVELMVSHPEPQLQPQPEPQPQP